MLEWGDRAFFLYVGTDKAASTWVHDVLAAHPECFVPAVKDLYYFDKQYFRGESWYRGWFDGVARHHRAVGELSHDYLYSHVACLRIRRDVPTARIIISLREPVSRAFSNYLFLVKHGLTRRPFREALDRFPELIAHGLYADVVRRYVRTFGEEQVLVMLFDEVRTGPAAAAARLFGFLGLRQDVVPDAVERKRLPAAAPRNPALAAALKGVAVGMRRFGLEAPLGRLKSSRPVQRLLYREYETYPTLDPEVRAELAPFFAQDIQDVEALLGVDLTGWRVPAGG